MRSFIKRITEGHKIRAEYPYGIAFDLAADLRQHLEDGIDSVPLTLKAGPSSEKRAALEAYKKAAVAIVSQLGRLEDALADLDDAGDDA